MSSNIDLEKGFESGDLENGTTASGSPYPASGIEKAESETFEESAVGTPDLDHEEVEQMDAGHLEDLERRHVCLSCMPS